MRKTIACLAVLLAGCATPEQRAAAQQQYVERLKGACSNYGFQFGTPEFANCMMTLDREVQRASAANNAVMLQQGVQMMNQSGPQPFPQAPSTRTDCIPMAGGAFSCINR